MNPISINDRIYGKFKITEPVLIELINSKPLQRLKKINQHGLRSPIFYNTVSRYEHSTGVMLVLKKFGAGLPEQIAGLFHDIAHTAFSHVIDHALSRSRQDNFHESYVDFVLNSSAVPGIFKKYHLDFYYLTHEKNFPLVDRDGPSICADRLDYFLRDSLVCFHFLTKNQVKYFLNNIQIINNNWVFNNRKAALIFGKKFIYSAKYGWYNVYNKANYFILGRAIKIAMDKKLILETDLFSDDATLMAKLRRCGDQDVLHWLKVLKSYRIKIDRKDYTFATTPKFRAVDPLILEDGKLINLTEINAPFKKLLKDYKKYLEAKQPVKIITSF